MKTLVILLVLVVIGIVIYKLLKKKKPVTTTLAPSTTLEPITTTMMPLDPIHSIVLSRVVDSYSTFDLCNKEINQEPALFESTVTRYFRGVSNVPKQYTQLYTDMDCTIKWESELEYHWAAVLEGNSTYTLFDFYVTMGGLVWGHYECMALTTLAPTTFVPTTTIEPIKLVYYKIFRCDTEEYLETGPIPDGSFISGDRVEGDTNVFYVVAGSSSDSFGYQNIMVTKTDKMGC